MERISVSPSAFLWFHDPPHLHLHLLLFSQLLGQVMKFFVGHFSDAHGIKIVKTNFFCYFTYLFDQRIQIVTICTIILIARPY